MGGEDEEKATSERDSVARWHVPPPRYEKKHLHTNLPYLNAAKFASKNFCQFFFPSKSGTFGWQYLLASGAPPKMRALSNSISPPPFQLFFPPSSSSFHRSRPQEMCGGGRGRGREGGEGEGGREGIGNDGERPGEKKRNWEVQKKISQLRKAGRSREFWFHNSTLLRFCTLFHIPPNQQRRSAKRKLSRNMYTLHTRFLHVWVPTCMLSR